MCIHCDRKSFLRCVFFVYKCDLLFCFYYKLEMKFANGLIFSLQHHQPYGESTKGHKPSQIKLCIQRVGRPSPNAQAMLNWLNMAITCFRAASLVVGQHPFTALLAYLYSNSSVFIFQHYLLSSVTLKSGLRKDLKFSNIWIAFCYVFKLFNTIKSKSCQIAYKNV